MKKLIINLLRWLRIVKKTKSEQNEPIVADFATDKDLWINLHGRPKMKLRKHVREIAEEITTVSNNSYNSNRDIVIAYYNNYGLKGMHEKIVAQFEEFNLKNTKETYHK